MLGRDLGQSYTCPIPTPVSCPECPDPPREPVEPVTCGPASELESAGTWLAAARAGKGVQFYGVDSAERHRDWLLHSLFGNQPA